MIRIGVLDSSQGNGHMFSFSAIINGLNEHEINQCDYQTILSYIQDYETPVHDIAQVARVTAIQMEDLGLAQRVAKFANINKIYDSELELARNVDALIITNDDPSTRNFKMPALLEFGKPIFLDKIIAYSKEEYMSLKKLEKFNGQIYSSSAMQHAPMFNKIMLTEEMISLEISVPKSWRLYSVHAIELLLSILRRSNDAAAFISHNKIDGADVVKLTSRLHQIDISIVASNVSGTPFQTIEKFRNGSQNVLTMVDPFEAFSKMISEFLTSIITNTYADKRDWDISIIELISKGLN